MRSSGSGWRWRRGRGRRCIEGGVPAAGRRPKGRDGSAAARRWQARARKVSDRRPVVESPFPRRCRAPFVGGFFRHRAGRLRLPLHGGSPSFAKDMGVPGAGMRASGGDVTCRNRRPGNRGRCGPDGGPFEMSFFNGIRLAERRGRRRSGKPEGVEENRGKPRPTGRPNAGPSPRVPRAGSVSPTVRPPWGRVGRGQICTLPGAMPATS